MRGFQSYKAVAAIAALCLLAACGGSTPPAETAEDDDNEEPLGVEDEPSGKQAAEEPSEGGEEGSKQGSKEPEFKEGMSVDEAINAVPQGSSRENVDQETLAQPLMDAKLYEPCKPKPNAHFKLKVAVWAGRAVGIDVDTQPKNETLADCVKQQVSQVQWKDKVKSLNTVEFQY